MDNKERTYSAPIASSMGVELTTTIMASSCTVEGTGASIGYSSTDQEWS